MTLAVPASRRGAFMSLSGCARDLTMGVTSGIGGWIVTKTPSGHLLNYHWLGWLAVAAGVVSVWLGSRVRVNDHGNPAARPAFRPEGKTAPILVQRGEPSPLKLSTEG